MIIQHINKIKLKKSIRNIVSASLLTLLFACGGSKQATTINKAPEPKSASHEKDLLSASERADVTYAFYNANKEKILGNMGNAVQLFGEVIRKDPNNAASMYELSKIYADQKNFSDALYFAKSAYKIDPRNEWYALSLAKIYQQNNKYNEAADVLGQLVKTYPNKSDNYFEWASALLYANKINEAVKVYDDLEKQIGVTEEVSLQKARIYQRSGKDEKALDELKKLSASNPSDVRVLAMMAEVYQSMKQSEKALETYQRILTIDPDNAFVHISLADYYRELGDKEKSFSELKLAFNNRELGLDTKISILSSYFTLINLYPELKLQALELCEILVNVHGGDAGAHAVYADFLSQDKRYDSARVELRKAKELGSKDFAVTSQILVLHSQLQDWDALLKDSEEAMSNFPEQPVVYYFNGLANIQKKNYEPAVQSLQSGLKLVVDNKDLQSQLYATLGDAYNELKEYGKSDINYDKALEIDSNNVYVLNNFAYYLSERGEQLLKAEAMSRKSNELETNNASFQDTYGWIFFKQGKFEEARIWIDKALKNGSDKSAVVLEHYGDVLYRLGRSQEAVEYWNKAKVAGEGATKWLDIKIRDKKLVE